MDSKKITGWLAGMSVVLVSGLLIASGIQIVSHQKTITQLEKSLVETQRNLQTSELNLKNAVSENESLNKMIGLQADLKKEAEQQRVMMVDALQNLHTQLKQAYIKLPKPVSASSQYQEPKEDIQRSFQRILVIWDSYCTSHPTHPNCTKEKP
jgi:septal ring factor EnvC (AmiA/AmiB activator)